ncbi:MAG: DEAD/DEAH box helicase [Atopostipes suicloacalis]|nr:DEAD/DEAH box helicase [Atopostipes suicloacalis]
MITNELNIIEPITKSLTAAGYTDFTDIQKEAIPHLLEGKDLLASAQTGTGKTAAFAVPILQGISYEQRATRKNPNIKALIVAPTRELAIQIGDSFRKYGKYLNLKTLVVFGGVSQHPQTKQLKKGVDILVATPGRLLDLMNQKHIRLNQIQYFVLDEADMMLDMGMLADVKRIVKHLPKKRQTMCFSATMPKEIEKLTNIILKDPLKIQVAPVSSTVDRIKQEVYFVDPGNKTKLLIDLLGKNSVESALVFSRTKHGADKIVKSLTNKGFKTKAIHGNKSQNVRQRTLRDLKERKINILVATDVAARGLDISDLSHVINYNLPEVAETYVHRIGRTGRAGHEGIAISLVDHGEKGFLRKIEKLTGNKIPVNNDHDYPLKDKSVQPPGRGRGRGRRRGKKSNKGSKGRNRRKSGKQGAKNNKSRRKHSGNKNRNKKATKKG